MGNCGLCARADCPCLDRSEREIRDDSDYYCCQPERSKGSDYDDDKTCPWKWEDLWTYKAPRLVVYQNIPLAIARGIYLTLVLVYFIVYEIVLRQSYLETDAVNPTVVNAKVIAMSPTMWPEDKDYCCSTAGCVNAKFGATRGEQHCVTWDLQRGSEIVSSAVVFIPTRVNVRKYQPVDWECELNATSASCGDWFLTSEESYYVADAENSVVAFSKSELSQGEEGEVLGLSRTHPENVAAQAIPVTDILLAVGVALDTVPLGHSQTYRYDGVGLTAVVDPGAGANGEVSIGAFSRSNSFVDSGNVQVWDRWDTATQKVLREEWERHGIHITFLPGGEKVGFSLGLLLRAFAASGVLLYISTIIIDWLIIPCLSYASILRTYRECHTVEEPDTMLWNKIKPDEYIAGVKLSTIPSDPSPTEPANPSPMPRQQETQQETAVDPDALRPEGAMDQDHDGESLASNPISAQSSRGARARASLGEE